MRRFSGVVCRNWFLIDPLYDLSSRSNFGLKFAEVFLIEKRLPDSVSRRVGDSPTWQVGDSPTWRVGDSPTRWVRESGSWRLPDSASRGVADSPTQRVGESTNPRLAKAESRLLNVYKKTQRVRESGSRRLSDSPSFPTPWLTIATPWLGESESRRLPDSRVADSVTTRLSESESYRLPNSESGSHYGESGSRY